MTLHWTDYLTQLLGFNRSTLNLCWKWFNLNSFLMNVKQSKIYLHLSKGYMNNNKNNTQLLCFVLWCLGLVGRLFMSHFWRKLKSTHSQWSEMIQQVSRIKSEHPSLLNSSHHLPVSPTAFTILFTQIFAPTIYITLKEYAFIYICAILHQQNQIHFFLQFLFSTVSGFWSLGLSGFTMLYCWY